jgi:methionyl-tRNA formyltransferase
VNDALKVVAVTQDDPFIVGRFFRTFLPEAERLGVDVAEIVILPNFNESKVSLLRRLVRFYGPLGVIGLAGRYAVAAASDRLRRPRSVVAAAARYHVPVRRLRTINDPSYLQTLNRRGVDVLLSVSAPEIFRRDALAAAPHVVNVHSGKLPEYRGMMPTFWALADGAESVTVTVHEMVERLDAGPILGELTVPVEARESAFDVAAKAKELAGRELARMLARLGTGPWPAGRVPAPSQGPAYGFPTREAARRLRASGRRLL